MKKIININLSGRVIPIEDAAYERLQAYIESLRRYFANEEGRDEIINDIESRIAELMSDKIRLGAAAITDQDVSEIVASMGTVEDFVAAEQESTSQGSAGTTGQTQEQQSYSGYTQEKKKERLHRDSSDKFIGGVCSGIAHYLNIDPSIVRILFAIITIGGFGLGILIYIILWIVLPPKDLEANFSRRLYRNPDSKLIGGVASGLAAYFKTSANTIRLIFAAPILLGILTRIIRNIADSDPDFVWNIGFGSLTGTFFLAYIILWIVLPSADSDYQKMEMRGEKVDVNRIRQNVKEGMSNMKDRMKGWSEDVKTTAQQVGAKGKEMASEFSSSARRAGGGLGHAIGVIFKVFFLFVAGSIAFGLFVALMALIFGGVAWWPINNFLWTSDSQQVYAWGTFIFFLVVPLIGFVTWIIRRIIRSRSKNNYLGWTFGGLWAIGWVMATLFTVSLIKDFRQYEHIDSNVAVTQPAQGKMIVAVSEPGLEYSGGFGWMNDESDGWDIDEDTLRIAAVKLNVRASDDSQYHVIMKKYSFGKTSEEALLRAEKIRYNVTSRDSVLDLGNGYTVDKESKFRVQNVEIEIHVPIGKKIRIDESVKRKLNSLDVRIDKSRRRDRIANVEIRSEREDFPYRVNVDYTMGVGGVLLGPDGKEEKWENRNQYRYDQNTDSIELQKEIERKERELQELKDRKNNSQKSVSRIQKKKVTTIKPDIAIGPSPEFSTIHFF